MERVDTSGDGWSSGLIVRGVAKFDSTNEWKTGYEFLHSSEYQDFSVWKTVGGAWTNLQPWSYTGTIVPNDWNRLKVTADGNQLLFFINDTLVWSGSDSSLVNGVVGIVMYQGSGGGNLNVDWATLGMSDLFNGATLTGVVQPGLVKINSANASNNPERAH